MRKGSIARRYAQALIDIGREDNAHERYGHELRELVAVFKGNPLLYKILMNPMYNLDERKAVTDKLCDNLGASEIIKKFVGLLVERRNLRLLEEIGSAYARLEDDLAGRVRAEVHAPDELGEALLQAIRERLKKETNKDVVLSFRKRPELIGGFVVRMDNLVLDGSIKAQLENMKEKLLEGEG